MAAATLYVACATCITKESPVARDFEVMEMQTGLRRHKYWDVQRCSWHRQSHSVLKGDKKRKCTYAKSSSKTICEWCLTCQSIFVRLMQLPELYFLYAYLKNYRKIMYVFGFNEKVAFNNYL